MRKLFFLALSLLTAFMLWAAPAQASDYKGYYYGADNPGEIADLVERSLAQDPSGRTLISAENCRTRGGCAAPINYLESFQAHDPAAGLTSVSQLPEYLRKLRIDCTVSGEYQMDRIILRRGERLGRTDVNGMSRRFHRDECAWVNPETGRPVLAQNCANPVGQKIVLDCVYVDFEVRHPDEFSVIWARYNRADDECFAYRRVNRLFQADSRTALWHDVPRNCIGVRCDLTAVNRALGRQNVAQGQIPLQSPGRYQIRLARNELLVLCLKLNTPNGVASSFSAGVRWQQDYQLVNRTEHHARIHYNSDELQAAEGPGFAGPRKLLWWASDRKAEAQMRGVANR